VIALLQSLELIPFDSLCGTQDSHFTAARDALASLKYPGGSDDACKPQKHIGAEKPEIRSGHETEQQE
jgi:hypothetical protein